MSTHCRLRPCLALIVAAAIATLPSPCAGAGGEAAGQPPAPAAAADDAPIAPGGELVEFRLAPIDGTAFTQTLVTQRDRSMEGIGKEEARAIGRTRYSIARTTDGWTYSGRLVSSETTRDGRPFDDPYGLVLTDVTVKLDVADDGSVRKVLGYDGLAERVQTLFSPEIAAKLEPFVGPKALSERAVADWRGRIGDFVGLTVSIGDTRSERLSHEIPGGVVLEYDVETRFAGWQPCAAGQCLRIETHYDSAGDAGARATARLASADAGDDAGAAPSRIAGSSTRLVDPATMLIYSEEEERTVWASLEIEGLGLVPLVEVSTMTYSYEYE